MPDTKPDPFYGSDHTEDLRALIREYEQNRQRLQRDIQDLKRRQQAVQARWRCGVSFHDLFIEQTSKGAKSMAELKSVSVIGLGKVGAPLLAAYACAAGAVRQVVGMDVDEAKVDAINHRLSPVPESGLAYTLERAPVPYSATADMAAAVQATDVTYVITPTPGDRGYDVTSVETVVTEIARALQGVRRSHTIVIVSTVNPGDMQWFQEILTLYGVTEQIRLIYSPEFIALGSVLYDLVHPDFTIIGTVDGSPAFHYERFLEDVFRAWNTEQPPVARLSWTNAEWAKLLINGFLDVKISFANSVAMLADRVPGMSAADVLRTVGRDRRIGPNYLKAGAPYGGPCLPRDTVNAVYNAERWHGTLPLLEAADRVNNDRANYLLGWVADRLAEAPEPPRVAVLGLAYKPDTEDITASFGISLVETLLGQGYAVMAYDPLAVPNARRAFRAWAGCVSQAPSFTPEIVEAVGWASHVVLALPYMDLNAVSVLLRSKVVLDLWGTWRGSRYPDAYWVPGGVPNGAKNHTSG